MMPENPGLLRLGFSSMPYKWKKESNIRLIHWREKHTLWAKDKFLPELKGYKICRVIETFGNADVFGISQIGFNDVESARRVVRRLLDAPPDKFITEYITNLRRILVREEKMEL
jgi:hypothetical protein